MAQRIEIEKHLDPPRENGDGMSFPKLVQAIYSESLGVTLPDSWPEEIYNNGNLFWEVGFNEELEAGDIFLVDGVVALYLETDEEGSQLLHSDPEKGIIISTLKDFSDNPRYEVRRIRRNETELQSLNY